MPVLEMIILFVFALIILIAGAMICQMWEDSDRRALRDPFRHDKKGKP